MGTKNVSQGDCYDEETEVQQEFRDMIDIIDDVEFVKTFLDWSRLSGQNAYVERTRSRAMKNWLVE